MILAYLAQKLLPHLRSGSMSGPHDLSVCFVHLVRLKMTHSLFISAYVFRLAHLYPFSQIVTGSLLAFFVGLVSCV